MHINFSNKSHHIQKEVTRVQRNGDQAARRTSHHIVSLRLFWDLRENVNGVIEQPTADLVLYAADDITAVRRSDSFSRYLTGSWMCESALGAS